MRNIIIIGFLLSCLIPLQAQTLSGDGVRVENKSIELLQDDMLNISMDLVLPEDFKLPSRRMVGLTPIIRDADRQEVLPTIHIYGRRRMIIDERENRLPDDSKVIQRENRTNRL